MSKILLFAIYLYQTFISSIIRNIGISSDCRFDESCSRYSYRVVSKHGVVKGSYLSAKRLINCQPYFKV